MFVVIDLCAVALIIFLTFWGFKKGFVKSFLGFIGFILALVLSASFSEPIATTVYDDVLSDAIKNTVSKTFNSSVTGEDEGLNAKLPLYFSAPTAAISGLSLDDILNQIQNRASSDGKNLSEEQLKAISGSLQNAAGSDATVEELVDQYNKTTGDKIDANSVANSLGVKADSVINSTIVNAKQSILGIDVGKIIGDILKGSVDVSSISNGIVDNSIRPVAIKLLSFIIFLILFIILSLVFALISSGLNKVVEKLPVVGSANAVLGGAFGFIKGLGWTVIILIVLNIFASGSDNVNFRKAVDQSMGCNLVEPLVPNFEK